MLAAAVLAACGGEERARPTAPPDPGREYRAALGQQCVAARFDRQQVPPPGGPTARDLADYLEANARVARRSATAAEALRPPEALAADHLRARLLAREAVRLLERAARSARRPGAEPDAVLRRLEPRLNERIAEGNALADSIGLPQCKQAPLDVG